jgi:hypothetical protein
MQRVDGKLQIVELKTSSARRTVVLPRLAVRHLQEHKKRQDGERLALGDTWREHGLVFASSIGTPIEPRNVNRRWDELRQRAGLDWLRLHDLRHGCATFLQVSGVASAASFSSSCERRPPAEQRDALQQPRSHRSACTPRDLGCHHPLASSQTMMQPVRLQRIPE